MRISLGEQTEPSGRLRGCSRATLAVVELLTGLRLRHDPHVIIEHLICRIDLLVSALGLCCVLLAALAEQPGISQRLGLLLALVTAGTATAQLAVVTERSALAAAALLSAIVGWPLIVVALAFDGAQRGERWPVTIALMLVGFSMPTLLRPRLAFPLFAAVALVVWFVSAGQPEAPVPPLALLTAAGIGLARRVMTDRRERDRGQLGRLMDTLAPLDTLQATAAAAASAIGEAGRFDITLLGAFTPNGGFRHLAHASRLPGALPLQCGVLLPDSRATFLRARVADGPWVADWPSASDVEGYDAQMYEAGVRITLYAPIVHDGSVVALLGVGYGERTGENQRRRRRLLFERMTAIVDVATLLGAVMAPQLAELDDHDVRFAAMRALIEGKRFSPVFQPVVDLSTSAVVGYEALTRFADGERPDVVFGSAAALGLDIELEAATLAAALADAPAPGPRSTWLALNVSPEFVMSPEFRALIVAAGRPLVIELTEHVAVADYEALRNSIEPLRPHVSFAVDDAGAGFASLRHVLELSPDIMKLDVGLVRGIDGDPARQALVAAMIHFALKGAFTLIAEGIETPEELATLRGLGVGLGQGFLLGRPASAVALASSADKAA